MAKNEKAKLKKGTATFNLIGKAIVRDYTFTLDAKSGNSDWIYNRLNLQVECGECGIINAEMMGGYGEKRDNILYVHGKKKNDEGKDTDDYDNQWTIDFADRLDEDLHTEMGNGCFLTVGLEKQKDGKTFYKKFLSEYDAIEYIQEHLEEGMIVNVKGNIEYSDYQGNTQVKKSINSIVLSNVSEEKDFKATFSQSVLVDKDTLGKYESDTNAFPLSCFVVEYVSKITDEDGNKITVPKAQRNVVLKRTFDFDAREDSTKTEKILKKYVSPKKDNVHEITFDGLITKGGSLTTATLSDLPEDIQELVEMGVYTEEEALEKCVGNSGKKENYIFKAPRIKKVGKDKIPQVEISEDKYKFDELTFYTALVKELSPESDEEPFEADVDNDDEDEEEFDLSALLDDEE